MDRFTEHISSLSGLNNTTNSAVAAGNDMPIGDKLDNTLFDGGCAA